MRDTDVSVCGTPLQRCSEPGMPQTGYTRKGRCTTHMGDRGSHHVCLRNIGAAGDRQNFCDVTGQSNWCAHKGDWCVCEWAFERAVRREGCDAFDIKCDATNQRALDHYDRKGMTHAAKCIRRKCHDAESGLL